jgi:hypothetical protein
MSLNRFTTQSAWKSLTEIVRFEFLWAEIDEWLFYTFGGYNEISNNNFLLDNTKNPTPQIKGFYMCQLNFSTDGATNNNIVMQLGYGKNQVLGAELVTCGDFSCATPTDYWIAANSVISFASNQLTVDDTAGAGGDSRGYQSIETEIGKTYRLTFNRISTTTLFFLSVGSTPSTYSNIIYSNLGSTTGEYTVDFTAISLNTTLGFITGGDGITVYSNISVKEVIPASIEWSDAQLEFDSKGGNKWSTNLNALIHVKDVGDTLGTEPSTFQLRAKNTDGTNALNVNTLNANFIKIY